MKISIWVKISDCHSCKILLRLNLDRSFLSVDQISSSKILTTIFQGLDFLHNTIHMAHGRLNVSTCHVTQYWSIKLSDFGLNPLLRDFIQRRQIEQAAIDIEGCHITRGSSWFNWFIAELLHTAPELIRDSEPNGTIDLAPATLYPFAADQSGDIYSFGALCYQIIHRQLLMDYVECEDPAGSWFITTI